MLRKTILATAILGLITGAALAKQSQPPSEQFITTIQPQNVLPLGETRGNDNYEIQRLEGQINQFYNQGLLVKNQQKSHLTTQASPPIITIEEGQIYSDSLDVNTPEKWYLFDVANIAKLTAVLQQVPQNNNYNISLFSRPTGASEYSYVAESSMPGASNEQLSAIAMPGSYILVIQSVGTASNDPYIFGTQHAIFFDSNEPDDNFWQAKHIDALAGRNGTLDSYLDLDYFSFTLDQPRRISYKLTGSDYQAQLLYANGSLAFTMANNTDTVLNLPAQSYYWRIYSPSGQPIPENYSFTAKEIPDVHRITFRNWSDSHGSNNKFIWNHGNYFGLRLKMNVSGYAFDINNQPVEGAKIHFRIDSSVNSSYESVTLTTDSRGWYAGVIESPVGRAEYGFNESHGCSHYDLHTMTISDAYVDINKPLARVETMDDGDITNEDGSMLLYDIAFYDYGNPCP